MLKYDLAIVGSGFGGSLLSMIARQLGRSVVLLEKHAHPRIVIGESSTPLANLLLEELSLRYGLPSIAAFSKWGTWQQSHPEVACGLKRGFTFLHHDLDRPASALSDRSRQLLVAASPHDRIADTNWYRADLDHYFVKEAQRLGVIYKDHVQIDDVRFGNEHVSISATEGGKPIEVQAQLLVDATGPRGFLHRQLSLGETPLPNFPATQSIYSHFRGVKRLADQHQLSGAPYPIDDAAVHHVFDGGWVWILRFNNGITSAGIAATNQAATRLRLAEGAGAWRRLLSQIPELNAQFEGAEPLYPFRYIERLSFLSSQCTGRRWAMMPSAMGFVDPLLSTGIVLTLFGVERMADIIATSWSTDAFNLRLREYGEETTQDLLVTAELVGALYANFNNFARFCKLSLLYFAAASYAETARRLGKKHLANGFLLRNNSHFSSAFQQTLSGSAEIFAAIEPFDVAGLCRQDRNNWYPVDVEDLYAAAGKLGVSDDEVTAMLSRSGFDLAIASG